MSAAAPPASLRPAIFLDRDGTLNRAVMREGQPYPPTSAAEFELFPDAPAACRALKAAGYALVVATNQPDVGRGTQSQAAVEEIHEKLRGLLPEIDRLEVCYDPGRGQPSRRRKPEPGMLFDAAAALGLDLTRSWMVGDREGDIACGQRAGVRTLWIDRESDEPMRLTPDFRVKHLREAADLILSVR
jgi:D-glycero-D-manno-heptose 1,7-bisphosphate phosphatase